MGSVLEASWIHRIQVIFNEFWIRNYDSINSSINFITNYRSISGGTGSGFASLLLQQLSADYPKTITLDFVIYPSPNISAVIVEPYNALFSTHASLDHVDCSFLVDNEALYNICARYRTK